MISAHWVGWQEASRPQNSNCLQSYCTLVRSICSLIVLLAHTNYCLGSTLAISTSSNEKNHKVNQAIHGSQVAGDIIAIKEGANLDLSCPIVVQDEDMIISWTCENEPANIRSSRIHVTDSGKLRIVSARAGDSCNYRCEAANGFGTLSVVIKVIIVEKRLIDQLTLRNGQNSNEMSHGERNQHKSRTSITTPIMMSKSTAQTPLPHAPRVDVTVLNTSSLASETDIEMHIEPSKISVHKNLTFSLECRIKYAPYIVLPQILWLKEAMGPKPASLADALEQNLILLEDVYYHSLNWPRSVTYSNKSLTASSALLIRQSSYVHSGRYVCLAGYPSAIMNLQLNRANPGAATTQIEPISSVSEHMKSPLKYKIAHALVEVDDTEGKFNYQLSLNNLIGGKRPENSSLLMSVISSNSWMRNLTILLCLCCSILMLHKLVQLSKRSNKTNTTVSNFSAGENLTRPKENQSDLENATGDNLSEISLNRSRSTANIGQNEYKIEENLSSKRLNLNGRDIDLSTDHVYSEIGYKDDGGTKPASEPYYKQPKANFPKSISNG